MKKNRLFMTLLVTLLASLSTAANDVDILVKPPILAVDTDVDGVVDYIDQCAFTEKGAKVDARGCYIVIYEPREILLNVTFAVDSDAIESYFAPDIEAVAKFMREYTLTRLGIEGHTDSDGDNAYNQRLSERRARAVATLLVNEFSLPTLRVTARGFGEGKPLFINNTEDNKAKNRRVVAVIRSINEKRL